MINIPTQLIQTVVMWLVIIYVGMALVNKFGLKIYEKWSKFMKEKEKIDKELNE
jgi:hypothetical protein